MFVGGGGVNVRVCVGVFVAVGGRGVNVGGAGVEVDVGGLMVFAGVDVAGLLVGVGVGVRLSAGNVSMIPAEYCKISAASIAFTMPFPSTSPAA